MPSIESVFNKTQRICAELHAQGELINPDPLKFKNSISRSLKHGLYNINDTTSYFVYPVHLEKDDPRVQTEPEDHWNAVVLAKNASEAFETALHCIRTAQQTKQMHVIIDVWPDVTVKLTNVGLYPLNMLYYNHIKEIQVENDENLPDVEIVSYSPQYSDAIVDLYVELLTSEYAWVHHVSISDIRTVKRVFLDKGLPKMLKTGNHFIDIAIRNGYPVGFIFLTIEQKGEELDRPQKYSEFDFLVTTQTERRKGIGQSLVYKSIKRIKELSGPNLILVSTVATSHISNPFWRKLGFIPYHGTLVAP